MKGAEYVLSLSFMQTISLIINQHKNEMKELKEKLSLEFEIITSLFMSSK